VVCSWQSRDFRCSGRLSIGSTGRRNMLLGVALAASALDARGGIVGGAISLSSIDTYGAHALCSPLAFQLLYRRVYTLHLHILVVFVIFIALSENHKIESNRTQN
jgi:hypothetical protein